MAHGLLAAAETGPLRAASRIETRQPGAEPRRSHDMALCSLDLQRLVLLVERHDREHA